MVVPQNIQFKKLANSINVMISLDNRQIKESKPCKKKIGFCKHYFNLKIIHNLKIIFFLNSKSKIIYSPRNKSETRVQTKTVKCAGMNYTALPKMHIAKKSVDNAKDCRDDREKKIQELEYC